MTFHCFVFCLLVVQTIWGQSEKFVGDYGVLHEATNGRIEYKLSLCTDGTFLFHSYSKHDGGIPLETNKYGRGNWSAEKRIISFWAEKKLDVDDSHVLDFNNTKARFKSKSPRNVSARTIKTSLIFYSSGIFWVKGMELFKNRNIIRRNLNL